MTSSINSSDLQCLDFQHLYHHASVIEDSLPEGRVTLPPDVMCSAFFESQGDELHHRLYALSLAIFQFNCKVSPVSEKWKQENLVCRYIKIEKPFSEFSESSDSYSTSLEDYERSAEEAFHRYKLVFATSIVDSYKNVGGKPYFEMQLKIKLRDHIESDEAYEQKSDEYFNRIMQACPEIKTCEDNVRNRCNDLVKGILSFCSRDEAIEKTQALNGSCERKL